MSIDEDRGGSTRIDVDLLILKKSLAPGAGGIGSYRGTERGRPVRFDNLPDTHVANQLFCWFVEEGGRRGVVHDLKRAKQLVELLNLFGDSVFYEVVQVSTGRETVRGRGGLLGFDVAAGFNASLLYRFLPGEDRNETTGAVLARDQPVWELSELHRQFFSAKLNSHGLLQNHEDAEFCLRTAQALKRVRSGWVEGAELSEYTVVSLHKVL